MYRIYFSSGIFFFFFPFICVMSLWKTLAVGGWGGGHREAGGGVESTVQLFSLERTTLLISFCVLFLTTASLN